MISLFGRTASEATKMQGREIKRLCPEPDFCLR
jgi:hypothetical protein